MNIPTRISACSFQWQADERHLEASQCPTRSARCRDAWLLPTRNFGAALLLLWRRRRSLIEAAPPATLLAECGTNGAPDPGEVVTMSFPLRNVGTGLTTDLIATLQNSGGITPISGPQNYGVISPVGAPVARPFTFAVSGAATCGSDIIATFALEDDGVSLGTVSFTIRVGAP